MNVEKNELIVSVIVVGFNGKQYLSDCLSSVLDQEMPQAKYQVIFVDNNSTDESAEYVKDRFPSVQVIRLEKNYGYYGAFNRVSTTIAQGKYLIPLPQDTIVHRKWLSELVRIADSENEVMICLVNTVFPTSPDYEKRERETWIEWAYLLSTTRLGQTTPKRWPFSKEPVPVLAYSGVSALIKRDVLAVTDHFFDPSLSHFLGDVEIGLRVNVLGYKVLFVPTAIVYHIEDNKSWSDIRLLLRALEGARDNFLVYYKNMYAFEFIFFLPLLLLGVPLKAYALRAGLWQRMILFTIALPLSPLALLLAILSFPKHGKKRRETLSKRKNGRFWLLRTILVGDRM